MDKNKKKIIIFVAILLIIIVIVAFTASIFVKDKESDNGSINNPLTNRIFRTNIRQLTNDNLYFSIQNLINDYYDLIVDEEKEQIFNILEEEYKNNNGITINNIQEKLNLGYSDVSYAPELIYYNPDSSVTYYFISGYYINSDLGHGENLKESIYKYNINFLVIVDENNSNYVLKPLDINVDINEYARNYPLKEIKINNGIKFEKTSITEKNKLTLYLSNFSELLIFNTEKAYDMTYDTLRASYSTYEDFNKDIEKIYNALQNEIVSFTDRENNNVKTYYIKDSEMNNIFIEEYSPNNFRFSLEFYNPEEDKFPTTEDLTPEDTTPENNINTPESTPNNTDLNNSTSNTITP